MKLLNRYKLRLIRQRRRARAFRLRRQLKCVQDNSAFIDPSHVVLFSTIRNENSRLEYFLDYYRRLGVGHFIFVDNGSDDETLAHLSAFNDITVYHTKASYKRSHYGMDWLNWLLLKYARNRWALVVDADEFFIYPHCDYRPLSALTDWLDASSIRSLGAQMIDLYPDKPLRDTTTGQNPFEVLTHFDVGNYSYKPNYEYGNLWIQGGMRSRIFFKNKPRLGPALNKTPLVKWQRGQVFISSTHLLLPRSLNLTYATDGGESITGAILHAKVLNDFKEKSRAEWAQREHYASGREYKRYAAANTDEIDYMHDGAVKYEGWRQLEALGLISLGGWS